MVSLFRISGDVSSAFQIGLSLINNAKAALMVNGGKNLRKLNFQVNTAIKTEKGNRQWASLGDLTDSSCMATGSCGAAGGAISCWVKVNYCPGDGGIVSSFDSSGSFSALSCRDPKMQ